MKGREEMKMTANGLDDDDRLNQTIAATRGKAKKTRKMAAETVRTIRGPMYFQNIELALNTAAVHDMSSFRTDSDWSKLADVQALRIEDEEAGLTDIPSKVWSLERLEILTLTLTDISVLNKKTLHHLQRMQRLTELRMPENKIKSAEGLQHIGSLTVLDLRRNLLTQLPDGLGTLTYLTKLYLAGNKLCELPESIGELANLEELDARSNRLPLLPGTIGGLKKLKYLDVGQNRLEVLPQEICELANLKHLVADTNKLTSLPGDLSKLQELHYVYLSKNQFRDVPEGLGTLESLDYLNLSHNQINSAQPVLYSVRTLILDDNQLEVFPDAIHRSPNLRVLSLQSNRLYDIPTSIGRLRNLRHLCLGGNQINELPSCISELADLRHLTINATRVQTLPDIGKLRRLSLLDISDTNMEPSIRSAFLEDGIDGVRRHLRMTSGDGFGGAENGDDQGTMQKKKNRLSQA